MLIHSCKACLLAIVQLVVISGAFGVIAPYFIEEPSNIYVRKGKPAVLNCRVGGDPKPSIKWKRNGITLTLDSRRMIKPDGSLYFSVIIHNKTQKPDEGTYQCEAVSYISVDYRIISRTARVIVAGISSKVAVTPSSLRSTYGDTSRLFCSIKHSTPKALFAWKKQGSNVTITTGNHYTLIPDGALQIRNIRFEDQGKYECIAANTETMRQHTSTNAATLQVVPDLDFPRQPHFETSPKDTLAISGNKVVLECIANGNPKPRVTWLHNGSPIQLGSRGYSIFGESNLVIQSVSVEHTGMYTCRAALKRFKEATVKLDVHYGPVFTKKPSVLHAHVNTNARFECTADGIPKPNITWAKNGEELSKTSDFINIEDGYLMVYDLVLSDRGAYQCFAKNSLGKIQATAELSVYRKGVRLPTTTPTPTQEPTTTVITTSLPTIPTHQVPEKPENVVARSLSDTEIELSWSPPTVTFGEIVEYSCFYYEMDKEGALGGTVNKVNTSGDNNRILISNLKPDTNYHFNVFAYNKNGAGAISDAAVAETYPSSQVPGRPRNLVAEAESDSTIRVTWAAPVTGPSSVYRYIIIYKDTSSISGDMRDVTKQQTRVLRNLKTYTKYTITVYAENQKGLKGASAVTEATTKGGVPRVAPTDFALKPDSSGTGLISTWTAPDPTKVNGRITFYTIKYRKAGSTDESTTERIEADRLTYVIKGLMPRTRYQAKIAAGTESGLGEYTRDWAEASTNVTNCKEDTNPGKPKFVNIERFSNAILVKWLPPDDAGVVCVTHYHLGWGKNAPFQFNSKPLSSNKTQYFIGDLLPDRNYVIKLWASNSKNVGLDIQIQIKTLAKPGVPEPVKSVKAVSRSPNVMRISWRDNPKVSSSMPVVYHVYSQHNQLLKYCGNTTGKSIDCTRLKPYTKYLFYVRRNEEGINATVSNFTMEDKPGIPMDLTGNPNEQDLSRLTLQWQPPLEHTGHILAYRIYYSINASASHEKWRSVEVDGSSLTKEISGLKPGTAYYFKMQARTKKGWGPMTSKKKVSTLLTPVTGIPGVTDPSATGLSSPAPSGPDAAAQAGGPGLKNKTLWIIIAAVAGITLIAIIIISVILCKKRSGDDIQRKTPTYKQVIQANGSAKKKHKEEKTPDLWINHTDNLEMKPMESVYPAPDVTNTAALIPRSSNEMRPLEDSPLDHMNIDHERSSFLNGSEADPDDFADLPPPPMIDSKGDPYLDYPDDNRTPTPPPSPDVSPFNTPRPVTPENVKQPTYPMTSTPRYPMGLPRTGSYENTLDVADPRPPQRSRSYDPDFTSPTAKVPVYPMVHQSPAPRPMSPKTKPPVAPADDIQLPPVGYNRKKPTNGYWAPPPRYEDIFARRSNPPSSPQREPQDAVVADLDKEIAGLEGLMRDLNEITAGDYII